MSKKLVLFVVMLLVTAVASQGQEATSIEISKRAISTLKILGFVDFLVPEGRAVWVTNKGRVEKLEYDQSQPVAAIRVPAPCGGMALGFGAVWTANCSDRSLYRSRQPASILHPL